MQGTVMMLMALSGLGCHNKGCDVVYVAPTHSGYDSGCYANVYPSFVSPQSGAGCYVGGYSGCYASVYDGGCFGGGCYGGGMSSCYSSCYARRHHGCGLLAKLFSCCGRGNRHGCYSSAYDDGYLGADDPYFYGAPYGSDLPYSPSVNGRAVPFNYGVGAPGEASMGYAPFGPAAGTPSEAVPPVQATPVSPAAPSATTPPAPEPGGAPPPTPKPVTPAVPNPPKPTT
jgi:hypothetical protein